MPRGRKPQPATLKVLSGARASRVAAPRAVPAGSPEPPVHLDDNARRKWSELAVPGMTRARAELVDIYAEAYSLKRRAVAEMTARPPEGEEPAAVSVRCGTGGLKPHPSLRTIRDCDATMLRVLADLARLDAATPAEPARDRLSEFIAKRKA